MIVLSKHSAVVHIRVLARIFAVASPLLFPSLALAQDSGIAGIVRDNSGGVVPGVTVTAASSALIEKQRVALTDGEGRYTLTQLRPGTYTVTFSLQGFATVVREGLQLSAGFTANIDAEIRPGGLEESITVTGASPIVDVANVRRQTVVNEELLQTLPTSTKSVGTFVSLTVGITGVGEVGGSYQAEPGLDGFGGGRFHGKYGQKVSYDGMGMENSSGNSSYQLNAASIEEMVLSTSGMSAESNADGIVINVVPKEGGNTFRTIVAGLYTNSSLESTNLSQDLKDRGLLTANKTIKLFDESVSVGGPIKRDRLWFFVAPRSWGLARAQAGIFWNKTQNVFLTPPDAPLKVVQWTPWVDRPEDRNSGRLEWYDSILARITYRATPKNKFNVTYDEQRACNCGSFSGIASHENYIGQYRFEPNRLVQATWNAPVTSKLLLEAGFAATISQWNMYYNPGVTNDIVSIFDLGLNLGYGSPAVYLGHPNGRDRYTERAAVSYVTGSHNLKAGFQNEQLNTNTYWHTNANVNYYFYNGTPLYILQWATPYLQVSKAKYDLGIYAQDQWKITNKLTLTLGIRWEAFNSYVPAQRAGYAEDTDGYFAGAPTVNPWLGQRTFAPLDNVPNWKDWNPRFGAAYDLFGNGKTALKFTLGRYVAKNGTDIAEQTNPIATSVTNALRGWTDTNHNYLPDCDLGNFAANGECGAMFDQNFGKNNPNAIRWDPATLNGYGVRDYNWDFTTEVQHELRPGVGLTGGWYHNTGGYFRAAGYGGGISGSRVRVTRNLAVNPDDFDPYCITAPRDQNLPNGGGYQICGMYDITPAKFGLANNYVTLREPFGNFISRNDFFNVTLDARLPRSIRLGGGFDTGRSLYDTCFIVDSPQQLTYTLPAVGILNPLPATACHVVTPFKGQTQLKLHGVVPFKGGFMASFNYQNFSGPEVEANYQATNAEISPSLGRDLAGGAQSVSVPLVVPQTIFEPRITRLDLRLSKIINVRRARFQINLDAYNVFNSNSVRFVNSAYGPNWRQPLSILDPRLFQIGGQLSF